MTGYSYVQKIHSLEKQLHALGMRWGHDKHGNYGSGEFGDTLAVFPRDKELPPFSRDAELFCGTVEQLQVWINGLNWARNYDMHLKVSDEKKREKGEVKYHAYLAKLQKQREQAQMLEVLRATDAQNQGKKK